MRFVPFALPPDAFERRLRDLRFRFRKWDVHVRGRGTVAPGALVLSRREHEEVVRIAEGLDAVAQETRVSLPEDEAAGERLGVPPALRRLVGDRTCAGRVSRLDFFPTPQGWQVSEFNDDVPGGYNDALGLAALFADAVEKDLDVPGDLPDALVDALAAEGGPVGLVYATAYAEDLQIVLLLADLLQSAGVRVVLGSPSHFSFHEGTARLAGEEVRAVYRFFPAEWFPLLDNLEAWEAAVAAGLRVVNPFRCAWTQSKAAFALLQERAAQGPGRALVERHLPRTVLLSPRTRAEALETPARWVLKPAFGRMGEGVTLGALVPPDEWRKALDAAAHREGPTVLQERFHVTPVEVEPGVSRTPCLGVYLVDGRFAGYYARLSSHPVVAYDAANVLTLVERV